MLITFTAFGSDYSFINAEGKKTILRPYVLNGKEYLAINRYYKSVFPKSNFDSKTHTISHNKNMIKITPATFFLHCTMGGKTYSAQMNLPAIKLGADLLVPLESFFTAINQFPGYSAGVDEKNIVMEKLKHENISVYRKEKNVKIENEKKKEKITAEHDLANHSSENEPTDDNSSRSNRNNESLEMNSGTTEPELGNELSKSFTQASAGFLDRFELINKIEKKPVTGKNSKSVDNHTIFPDNIPNEKEMSYPPNLYVIPKNLIRRELQEIKTKEKNE